MNADASHTSCSTGSEVEDGCDGSSTSCAKKRSHNGRSHRLLDAAAHPQRAVIDTMRALIARAVPHATESIKWNAPSFALAEHFATFHLRAKAGVHLVLHLGAKPHSAVDMREALGIKAAFLDWKGPDRAVVAVRDAAHLSTIQPQLARVIRAWAAHVL